MVLRLTLPPASGTDRAICLYIKQDTSKTTDRRNTKDSQCYRTRPRESTLTKIIEKSFLAVLRRQHDGSTKQTTLVKRVLVNISFRPLRIFRFGLVFCLGVVFPRGRIFGIWDLHSVPHAFVKLGRFAPEIALDIPTVTKVTPKNGFQYRSMRVHEGREWCS